MVAKSKIHVKKSATTNLMQLPKSRHIPISGDIFAAKMISRGWLIGRVIKHNIRNRFADGCVLLYVYAGVRDVIDNVQTPIVPKLLIRPMLMCDNVLWKRGLVVHVRNEVLQTNEVLRRHIFRSFSVVKDADTGEDVCYPYVNEEGKRLSRPRKDEIVGEDGFAGWRTFDDEISSALNVPLHPSGEVHK